MQIGRAELRAVPADGAEQVIKDHAPNLGGFYLLLLRDQHADLVDVLHDKATGQRVTGGGTLGQTVLQVLLVDLQHLLLQIAVEHGVGEGLLLQSNAAV